MENLNILIIDRSRQFALGLKEVLERNEAVEAVRATTDMDEALHMLADFPIHIVMMDVMYPDCNGQTALKTILNHRVIPIIVVADRTVEQTAKTVTAMGNGAIDFIKKTDIRDPDKLAEFEAALVLKMQNVKKANRLRSIARKIKENPLQEIPELPVQPAVCISEKSLPLRIDKEIIVVVGASTGGPRALYQFIQQIPKDFDQAILIVQHMPAGFTKSLADRLNSIGNIRVKEAEHGEKVNKGTAYIAPGNWHMEARFKQDSLRIELSQGHEYLPHRPSVDLLFKSVAVLHDRHKVAAVLTGMGRDGSDGALDIVKHEKEAVILAESNETAVIDGMPRSVIETGVVTRVLRIDKIGSAVVEYCKKRGK